MSGGYVIGVDGGTEGLRAGVYDLAGHPLAYAATPYTTNFPQPGRAEQDPNDWWTAIGSSVRQAIHEAGIDAGSVLGLCIDTTCCSVVALDANCVPLRPALIWMDVRSSQEAEDLVATGDPALAVNANGQGPVSAEWMIPKALWIRRNEPDVFAKAATVCEFQDYMNLKLTGRRCASINNVSVRWHYRNDRGGTPDSLLSALGIADLLDKWPRDVLQLGEPVGGLTPQAAEHLGLPNGLTVAQGGADAFIAMIGLGVIEAGSMAFITGSSHLHLGLAEKPFHGAGIWGTYTDALVPGVHLVEGGQTSTGSVVNWYKTLLGDNVSYDELNSEAEKVPPGSDGLVVQDHFQGNRTPHTDPHSRGAIIGLSLGHSRGHIFRAILEGISFGTKLILESMRANGYVPDEMVICGGATRSDLWLQIHADVSGVPLKLTKVADAPSLGCAILAATAAGAYSNLVEAVGAMVHVTRTLQPNAEAHAAYRPHFEAYKRAYPALKSIFDEGMSRC